MRNLKSKVPVLSQNELELINDYADSINAKVIISTDPPKALLVVEPLDQKDPERNYTKIGFIQRSVEGLVIQWKHDEPKVINLLSTEDSDILEEYAAMMGLIINWVDSIMVDILTGHVEKFKLANKKVYIGINGTWIDLQRAHKMAFNLKEDMLDQKTKTLLSKQLLKCVVDAIKSIK